MCPGIAVLAGGGGSGGGSGKGAGSGGGGVGAGGEGGAANTSDDQRTAPPADSQAVSHPVDVATGRAYTDPVVDLKLPGPLPLRWERTYSSSQAKVDVGLGFGWTHSYGWRIEVRRRKVIVHTAEAIRVVFDEVAVGHSLLGPQGWMLHHRRDGYALDTGDGLWRLFSPGEEGDGKWLALSAVEDRNGNRIALHYQDGRLTEIHDSVGRVVLVASTPDGHIESIKIKNAPDQGKWIHFATYGYDDR
ncbi:MAG: RHS repeat protein, partial [Deltaproteobacteria bacterium]|nr:RHS repeat protein [Deltaproteobacteria bacterium]